MPTFNPALQAALASKVIKTDYSGTIKSLFGANLRVRCFHDANVVADPAATGVEFLNTGSDGNMPIVAGNIKGFGVLSNVTKHLAANLATGSSVVRLEGNSYAVTFTLGLPGSGKEFVLKKNPTGAANEGFAFAPGAGLQAPIFMDSGTGPLSPPAPNYTIDFEDWSSGSAVAAGTLTLSERMVNQVFDDAEMAISMGDVRIHHVPQPVVLGEIEFGALLWSVNASINGQVSAPVDEILIISKPVNANWPGYPRASGYINGVSNTFAPPFKARLKKDGVVVKVFEMQDGLPMNHPSLNQNQSYSRELLATNPIRPFFCTGQVLPYRAYRHKMHTYAQKYYPGQEPEVLRPTLTRRRYSTNGAYPFMDSRNQINGFNQWFALPPWPVKASFAGYAADTVLDPFLWDIHSGDPSYGNMTGGSPLYTGWRWEPGANGGHDWYVGPGGARVDRAAIAGPIAIYMTKPDYVRPRNNDPILEMVEEWNKNYCNIPWHLVTDVTTGATIPIEEAFKGMWAQGGHAYYGANPSYVAGGRDYTVDMFSIGNGSTNDYSKPYAGAFVDKNNRMPFNGIETDDLHAYKSPFLVCALFNSPMAAYLTKHAVIANILSRLEQCPPNANPRKYFLVRSHAWRMKNYMEAWKISSSHGLGIARKAVEDAWQIELETQYDQIIVPMNAGAQDPYIVAMRNLGIPIRHDGGYWEMGSQSLTFYMTGELQLMKSTGSWDMIRAKSAKCKAALDFLIRCMDMYSIDWIIDTKGVTDWYDDAIFKGDRLSEVTIPLASSWLEVGTSLRIPEGPENWVTNPDGSFRGERDGSQHLRYQYACIRRDWIKTSEVPLGSVHTLAEGIAAYKGYYDKVATNVAAAVAANMDKEIIRNSDFFALQPSYGVIKPPVNL